MKGGNLLQCPTTPQVMRKTCCTTSSGNDCCTCLLWWISATGDLPLPRSFRQTGFTFFNTTAKYKCWTIRLKAKMQSRFQWSSLCGHNLSIKQSIGLSNSFSMNFSSRRFSMFCSRPCTRAKETCEQAIEKWHTHNSNWCLASESECQKRWLSKPKGLSLKTKASATFALPKPGRHCLSFLKTIEPIWFKQI